MALSCEKHTVYLYDRGGKRKLGDLGPLSRVKWGRNRDEPSNATVYIESVGLECAKVMALAETNRTEIVIFRGGERVWEGCVTHISYQGWNVEIQARDVMVYVLRTAMHGEYDNRYPNNGLVLDRVKRIMDAEMARKEACDPAYNVLPHVQYIYATGNATDAGTAAHTLPYELTLFEHIDSYAARGGLDYTVVGRSILFFDVHTRIGQTPMVTAGDFLGDPVITQYGMELATRVIMTDGKGHAGIAGGVDDYYGEWEILHQAYDENAGPVDENDIPTVAEMTSQAKRTYEQGKRPPLVVRVPDNTSLNPNGVLTISDLVPGVWIPLSASLPGRTVQQMQKLDSMTVEETGEGGETISVTMSPAYQEIFVEEEAP